VKELCSILEMIFVLLVLTILSGALAKGIYFLVNGDIFDLLIKFQMLQLWIRNLAALQMNVCPFPASATHINVLTRNQALISYSQKCVQCSSIAKQLTTQQIVVV
jgi:hypothetical protein